MKNKKRLIIIFVVFAIVLGIMAGICIFKKKNSTEATKKVATTELSDRQKDILGIDEDEDSKKENEIEEKSKSDLYKEYEKKSEEEKKCKDERPKERNGKKKRKGSVQLLKLNKHGSNSEKNKKQRRNSQN